jgi:uncharacterized protein YqjF (DUF2071 family)
MIRTPSTSVAAPRTPPPWLIAQRWERLLFAHWRVDPARLRAVLPRGVEPDVREETCWLAVVAFVMVGTRSCGPPWWPVLAPIPELNVRTYVRVHGVPAVWFLSLDASSTFFATFGRMLYGMRYHVADMQVADDGGSVRFRSARRGGAFTATYAPAGPVARAEPGSLEHFLVERYRLFAERRGRLITAEVAHEPWPLQPATARIEVNEMAPPGLELSGEPLLHFCRSVTAVISAPLPATSVPAHDASSPLLRHAGHPRARRLIRTARRARVPADAA